MNTTQEHRAVVVTRASSGGGEWIRPIRIYLAQLPVTADGTVPLPHRMTSAPHWASIRENKRATGRVRRKLSEAEKIAALLNAGEIDFDRAAEQFFALN